jgi:hypothetical protein
MRDYTYINGARFIVSNLYRSLRFDIDRLDMNWVDGERPKFVRGLRVVDNEEGNTVTVDGQDGDSLIYSLTYIFGAEDGIDAFRAAVDQYLIAALAKNDFSIESQKKDPEGKPEVAEAVIH